MNYMAISCIDQIEIFSYHVDNSIEIIMKNIAEKINKQISKFQLTEYYFLFHRR